MSKRTQKAPDAAVFCIGYQSDGISCCFSNGLSGFKTDRGLLEDTGLSTVRSEAHMDRAMASQPTWKADVVVLGPFVSFESGRLVR
jgi:hypothetical protein